MQGLEREEEKFTKLRKDALIKQSQTQQKITDLDKLMAEEKSSGLADAMKAVKDAEKLAAENENEAQDFKLQAKIEQAKNALADEEANQDKILQEKYGDNWRTKLAKIANSAGNNKNSKEKRYKTTIQRHGPDAFKTFLKQL